MASADVIGGGNVEPRALEEEMRTAYLDYAMSVIVGPSQRVCSRPTLVSTATRESTTLGQAEVGRRLNVEVDILAKHLERLVVSR